MRAALRIIGTLLIVSSGVGLVALGIAMVLPEADAPTAFVTPLGRVSIPWATTSTNRGSPALGAAGAQAGLATVLDAPPVPITQIQVPSIDLSADVVPADMIAVDGGFTWQVPAFKVGHAESTAGAGQMGNAVLLGHVTSVHSGNVFVDLDKVAVGDTVKVFSDADAFDYKVASIAHIQRSEASVLQPTSVPSVSLITCTGVWLPTIWDYTERLVVRAELSR